MDAVLNPIDLTKEEQLKVSLGCTILDGFLHGGLPVGLITELTGEASSGKTQIALQSLLTVQLPPSEGGLSGKAILIYTDGKPPVERIQSILENRFADRSDVSLAHVLIEERPISSPDDLTCSVERLETMLQVEKQQRPGSKRQGAVEARQVRLVVVDSVARVFRDAGEEGEPQVQQLQRRTAQLFTLATRLKRLAQRHGLAVLLTNQVMDKIGDDRGTSGLALAGCGGGSRAGPLVTGGRRVQPALGLAWANCVNARLFAAKHDALGNGVVRSLQVVFAPHLPHSYCCFTVAVDGVRGVDDEAEPAEPQQANCTSPSLPVHHHLQPA